LLKQIQEDDRIRDHPLKPILVEDIQQALTLSRRGTNLTQTETVEMAQHSAYLGMSRGLRTITSQVPPAPRQSRIRRQMAAPTLAAAAMPDEDEVRPPSPPMPAPAPTMTSPFANRAQTQLAYVMRSMSSQSPDEQS
jgi:hypothetical protein